MPPPPYAPRPRYGDGGICVSGAAANTGHHGHYAAASIKTRQRHRSHPSTRESPLPRSREKRAPQAPPSHCRALPPARVQKKRVKNAPRASTPRPARCHINSNTQKQKAKTGTYQGWVRTALTQPPPPIVAVSRNPSRKPALTEPVRQGEGPQWRAAAAPQTRRATRRAKRARNPSQATARTTPPPRASNRPGPSQPLSRPAPARPPGPPTPHPWHATPPPPQRATPLAKPHPHPSQDRPPENPSHAGETSKRSQATVRNPCPQNRTPIPIQASNRHRTARDAVFE